MLTYDMEHRNGLGKFEYLYERIRDDILAGRIVSGEKLPGKKTLAEHLGISAVTVEAAYGQLLDEGYVISRPRSGFYVSALKPEPAAPLSMVRSSASYSSAVRTAVSASESASASANASSALISDTVEDFPVAQFLRITREVLNDYRDRLMERPPNAGVPELREAIAEHLRRYRGMKVRAEQIMIGSGSEYLYGLIAQLFHDGTIFGIEAGAYEKIRLVYRAYRIRCETHPVDKNGILSSALAASHAGLLHVTPFKSFPAGVTASAARRYEYIDWAQKQKAVLVEDDFSSEFSVQRKPLETMYHMDRSGSVIYLNTFTKSIAPSMRIGYMVLPERFLPLWHEKLGFYACTVPALDQFVLAEYIRRGHFERRLNRIRRQLRTASGG